MKHRFRIIPVLDIKGKIAVSANIGDHNDFSPLDPSLVGTNNPVEIAHYFKEKYGFRNIYIADIDQIFDTDSENFDVLKKICEIEDLNVILDVGLSSRMEFKMIDRLGIDEIIIATETIRNFELIEKTLKHFGPEKVILSLDTLNSNLISRNDEISEMTPQRFIERTMKYGIKKYLLLELSYIGKGKGIILPIFKEIRGKYKDLELIISGGFSEKEHIKNVYLEGFNGVLISSGFYKGTLTPESIKELKEELGF